MIKLTKIVSDILNEGVYDSGILKCVFLAGGPGCFVDDTLVKTTDGYKPISTIKSGELVYTINEQTGETEIKPVLKSHIYTEHSEDLLELEFDTGDIVRCTENHKFYVNGEWIAAKDLLVE
jgi:intein/homing endonuclease